MRVAASDEAHYLADKDPEDREAWSASKRAFDDTFRDTLVELAARQGIRIVAGGDAPWVIAPRVGRIEPGHYAGASGLPSEVVMTVKISGTSGADEVLLSHGTPGSITNRSVGDRLRADAAGLAEKTADYLTLRVNGPR
jgi:hypothetical protein